VFLLLFILMAGIRGMKQRTTFMAFNTGKCNGRALKACKYMKKSTESLDDLEKGIKRLLLEDRCSFSDEDRKLLTEMLEFVLKARAEGNKNGHVDWLVIVKTVEAFLRLLNIFNNHDLF